MNTSEISRSTTMIFDTEQRSPTTSKRTTCVGEDSDNQRSSGDWKCFTSVCCFSDWQRYLTQKPQSTSPKKWEADISSNHNTKSVNTSKAEAGDSWWRKMWRACWRKGNHNSPSTSWGARKPTTWQHACWTDWSKDCVHKIRMESTSTAKTWFVKELHTHLFVDVEFCLIVKV